MYQQGLFFGDINAPQGKMRVGSSNTIIENHLPDPLTERAITFNTNGDWERFAGGCRALEAGSIEEMEAEPENPEYQARMEDILNRFSKIECIEKEVRVLGQYFSATKTVQYYGDLENYREIVEYHERFHAIHHLVPDENGLLWYQFQKCPNYLLELLAQLFTFLYAKKKGCKDLFLQLNQDQSIEYQTWHLFENYDEDKAIQLYWYIRRNQDLPGDPVKKILQKIGVDTASTYSEKLERKDLLNFTVWVIRQIDQQPFKQMVQDELKLGRLRQGWGSLGMELLDAQGRALTEDEWITKYMANPIPKQANWEQNPDEIKKFFRKIRRLTDVCDGDLIVIPKYGNDREFAIVQAQNKYGSVYQFDGGLGSGLGRDFCHFLTVDPARIIVFRYDSPEVPVIVSRLLRGIPYSAPVNYVANGEFRQAIDECWHKGMGSQNNISSVITARINIQLDSILDQVIEELNKIQAHDFEDVICMLLKAWGYTITSRNSFDKNGGDVDILASKSSTIFGSVEDSYLLVQVKKKSGSDADDIEGIKQLELWIQSHPDMKDSAKLVLVSLVDKFSEDCIRKAEKDGVLLVNGKMVAREYLKVLFDRTE